MTKFRVDGRDFEGAEAVNRYLVSGHTKAELIDLLMVSIKESVDREDELLDVDRLALYMHQARVSNDEPIYDMAEARRRAEVVVARLTEPNS